MDALASLESWAPCANGAESVTTAANARPNLPCRANLDRNSDMDTKILKMNSSASVGSVVIRTQAANLARRAPSPLFPETSLEARGNLSFRSEERRVGEEGRSRW